MVLGSGSAAGHRTPGGIVDVASGPAEGDEGGDGGFAAGVGEGSECVDEGVALVGGHFGDDVGDLGAAAVGDVVDEGAAGGGEFDLDFPAALRGGLVVDQFGGGGGGAPVAGGGGGGGGRGGAG